MKNMRLFLILIIQFYLFSNLFGQPPYTPKRTNIPKPTKNIIPKATPQPETGNYYIISSEVRDGGFVTSQSNRSSTNTPAKLLKSMSNPTKWELREAERGSFYIIKQGTNMALNPEWRSYNSGRKLILRPVGSNTAKFKVQPAANGFYIVPVRKTSLVVGMRKGFTGNNATIGLWTKDRTVPSHQVWSFDFAGEVPPLATAVVPTINATPAPRKDRNVRLSKLLIEGAANGILRGLDIRLNNYGRRHRDDSGRISWFKERDCLISFNGLEIPFTIDPVKHGVNDRKIHYVKDMNLQSIRTKFVGSKLMLKMSFEESGIELKGMCSTCFRGREDNACPDFEIENNKWDIELELITFENSVAFNVKNVEFLGEFDGKVFGELIDGIAECVSVPTMKREMRNALNAQKRYIASQLKRNLQTVPAIGEFEKVNSIKVVGRDVILNVE